MATRKPDAERSARIEAMLEQDLNFRIAMPKLYRLLQQDPGGFRGLTIIPSNSGGYLGIVKTYGLDGEELVGFCNGQLPIDAFLAIEDLLARGTFRKDKRVSK